jgi:hypothetical protein
LNFKLIYILTIFLLFANNSFAEKDTLAPFFDKSEIEIRKIDESNLEKFKNDEDFNYYRIYKSPETLWDKIKYFISKIINFLFNNQKPIGILIRYIIILILISAIIFFLVKSKFRRLFFKNKTISEDILTSEINEDINKLDIEDLIKKAKLDKNWRLATRYYYLKLLKLLSTNEIIVWEINKTNRDYINELRESNYFEKFKKLSKIYNYVWYGDFSISETDFIAISVEFDTVLQNIKPIEANKE